MSDEPIERTEMQQAQDRYLTAMHAMQSGVSVKQGLSPSETEPKHLRVGVNSTMMQQSALVGLLINKGIITELEWFTALADGAENEVKLYEQEISKITGGTVTLR